MFGEPEQGEVPTDADRARPELVPLVGEVVDEGDVLEPQRRVVTRLGEVHVDPADPSLVLPRDAEVAGRVARLIVPPALPSSW